MNIEAALLTGGASRRMGEDKAALLIGGIPLARRIADALLATGIPVTVLGREPVEGCAFLPDSEAGAGPLVALSRYRPNADFAFIAACDLPCFDPRLVAVLQEKIGEHEAAIPIVDGWRQPLCALYRREAWEALSDPSREESAGRSVFRWVDSLDHVVVDVGVLAAAGLDPRCVRGVNSRDELEALLGGRFDQSSPSA